jgi:hypothetical protein
MERLVLCLSKHEKQTEVMLKYPIGMKYNGELNTISWDKAFVQRYAKRRLGQD